MLRCGQQQDDSATPLTPHNATRLLSVSQCKWPSIPVQLGLSQRGEEQSRNQYAEHIFWVCFCFFVCLSRGRVWWLSLCVNISPIGVWNIWMMRFHCVWEIGLTWIRMLIAIAFNHTQSIRAEIRVQLNNLRPVNFRRRLLTWQWEYWGLWYS